MCVFSCSMKETMGLAFLIAAANVAASVGFSATFFSEWINGGGKPGNQR